MEITRWLFCVVVSCFLVNCEGKPISLNQLIEAESQLEPNQKQALVYLTTSPETTDLEPAAERTSLNRLKPVKPISKNYRQTVSDTLRNISKGKRISPLTYRKTFQIKSPLKPKRVKASLGARHRRRNKAIKREIDRNAFVNQKYIPLLRSLGMLFDNILGTDSNESLEDVKPKKKRLRLVDEGEDDKPCQCPRQEGSNDGFNTGEEAVTSATTVAAETTVVAETATETTYHPASSYLRSFGHHQNIPLLLPRNTSGTGRNHHGVSQGSRAAYHGSAQGYITGVNGDSKHYPKWRQEQSDAESYERHTDSDPRDDASGAGTRTAVRARELRDNSEEVFEIAIDQKDQAEKFLEIRKDTGQSDGPNKFENKRYQAESGKLLPKPFRREGSVSDIEITKSTELVQSENNDKESIVTVTYDNSGDQRLPDRDGSYSSENKETHAGTETQRDKLTTLSYSSSVNNSGSPKTNTKEEIIVNNSIEAKQNGNSKTLGDSSITMIQLEKPNQDNKPVYDSADDKRTVSETSKAEILSKEALSYTSSGDSEDLVELTSNSDVKSNEDKYSYEVTSNAEIYTGRLKSPSVQIPEYFSGISKTTHSKGPMVMIIDGYSVTRHKNGENKLAEKSIRIRP